MGQIKINGSFFGEENQIENNYALEYLKRNLTEHKEKSPLDHPDGSVTEEKLSPKVVERMTKHESDIQELDTKKADKSDTYTKTESDKKLYTKADRTTVYTIAETDIMLSSKADKADTDKEFDEVKENHSAHVLNNDCHFMYGEREEINQRISDLRTTKADKADTYTIAEVDDKLSAKPDRTTVYTKVETDEMLSDKPDKADFDWVFLGECKLSETAHFLTIDLGNTIETEWYKETLMLVEIPAYTNQDNGSVAIRASVTESGGLTTSGTKSTIITTQSKIENLGALSNGKKNNLAVKTQWINNSPVITDVTRQRGDGKAYSQYSVGTTNFSTGESIIGSQYITLVSLDKELFVFPAKSKISLYGRLRYEI